MLLELFIMLQIIAIITFAVAFFRKNEWFWALALIFFGVLIFASYDIQQNVSIVTNQTMIGNTVTYNHNIVSKQVIDKTYSYLNMGLFLLALLLFMFDLFNNWKNNRSVKRP
jgi:hypothetical protein